MITKEGTAKLMDFGLAKIVDQPKLTQEGIIVGTVAYIAPEAALGKNVDVRSDLYSFGAVLYEALSGKPPFQGDDPIKVIFGHIHDHPVSLTKLNPKAPQGLVDCIMKLLEKEPERRYQSAADLLKALREVSEEFLRETTVLSHKSRVVVPIPHPISSRETQLIDRVQEIGLLRETVDRTIRSEGGLVFLCGEAGIGKTRLTRELRAYARLRGMQVLYGRCPALFGMDSVPPYTLWREVLRDYVETSSPEQLYKVVGFYAAEIAKIVPEIGQKLRSLPQSLPISPEHERDRLFEAVSQFIINLSKENPLLIVLDDLQWTDQTSLLLMHHLARGIYQAPLLLLGAYRQTDIDEKHPLSPVLAELNRERLFQSVRLERMSFNDISEMIKQILEQDDVPKEFCELVYEKTRGNPFFAEEMIKSLKEEEIIYREENKWRIKEVSRIELPKNVKSVIEARISRLDEECQNVLTMASFVGNDFTFESLLGVTDFEENRLLELMERLLRTRLIKESVIRGQDNYCFADVIVRDVLHEEVSRLRHSRIHLSVGNALERVYIKKIDQHFGELANHFLEGGDKNKALEYFLKAGENALKVHAHNEAYSYLQNALELLEEKADNLETRAHITESLGDTKAWIGETSACMEYWTKSITLRNEIADRKGLSRLHVKMAHVLWDVVGDKDKAWEHHRASLDILEKEPESIELASLYEDISRMFWRRGESSEALSYAQKAFALAQKLGSPEVISECYNDLARALARTGEAEKAIDYCERGLRIALENNCTKAALRSYSNLGGACEEAGEFQKAFETYLAGYKLAKEVGEMHLMSWIGVAHLAWSYWLMGELEKSGSFLEELLVVNKRLKNTIVICQIMYARGIICLTSGELDKSLQYMIEARDIIRGVAEYQLSGEIAYWLGELYVEMEDYVEAEKHLSESKDTYERAEDAEYQFAKVFPALSKLYLRKGEVEKARELIEKTHEHATKSKNRLSMASAEMLKALLFREQKNWEQSIQHFEKSLQGYKSLNAQKWCVHQFAELLYEYGSMYLDRNEEGDKEKAYSFLDQALMIYQKMDAKKKMERIIAKKRLLTA